MADIVADLCASARAGEAPPWLRSFQNAQQCVVALVIASKGQGVDISGNIMREFVMADYHYREAKSADPTAPLFVVLHGTGGDENQFFDLASQLLPGARVIAVRGDVSEGGALRYFRRTGEGVYDMADLAQRTAQMVAFVRARQAESQPRAVVGLGYSNGANILASVQFAAPELFDATVLLHPLIPFTPPAVDFSARRVLITGGQRDPICPPAQTRDLHDYFAAQGAQAALFWHPGGHEVRPEELREAQAFLAA